MFSRWPKSPGVLIPRCPAITAEPAWPGRAPLDNQAETHMLSGTAIEPSASRPTPATWASTAIDGMRSRAGVIGPPAEWELSSTGGGAGLGLGEDRGGD